MPVAETRLNPFQANTTVYLPGTKPHRLRWAAASAALLAGPSLHAGVIQVSLGDNAGPALYGPAGGRGTIWNDWRSLDSGLKDSTGALTPVTFMAEGEGPHGDWWCDIALLASGAHVDEGASKPLVISGLVPHKSYDLHLASSWGNKQSHTIFRIANPTNTAATQPASGTGNATTWDLGANFVFFQDVEADDSGEIRFSYEGSGSYGILNGFQLVGPIEVPTATFQSWAADPAQELNPAENDGPLDDPDQDGLPNLLEFALGGPPTVASQAILPKLVSSGGKWTFEYDRNDASRPPFTSQTVEYSTDLVTWTPVNIPVISGNGVTLTDNGATDHVQVALPASGGAMFARLRAAR